MDISSVTLLLLGFLCLSLPASWGELREPDSTSQDPQRGPHLTGCMSRELESFYCWWSAGSFQNLTEPGALRLFYTIPNSETKSKERSECPQYSSTRPNECHFSRNYTHIWVPYCVELRSVEQNITYDEIRFTVESIVKPDPPVNLNWTLLNVSHSSLHFDIMVHWEPPASASAAVDVGWMSLVYQIQYRVVNTSHWEILDQDIGTHQPIYGLLTDRPYEVRIRCKMRGYNNFGEYSNTIAVLVAGIPSKDASFPMTLVMVFGVVGMVILLMLIIFTQQQRLMVILLPPVPAPKIKGIDSELLKKGKLDDLNSILSSQHMFKPEMFLDESWVEFIELDIDEPDKKASETRHLLAGVHGCLGSSQGLNLKDDDSGRASCYDPELPMDAEALLMAALLPPLEQAKAGEGGGGDEQTLVVPRANSPATGTPAVGTSSEQTHPPVQNQVNWSPNWANMDFYAQVSDVTPTGGVVLSAGSLLAQEQKKKEDSEKGGKKNEEEENKTKEEMPKFHLLVVNPDGGYTSESVARHISSEASQGIPGSYQAPPPTPPPLKEEEQPGEYQWGPVTSQATPAMSGEYQNPYLLPDANLAVPPMAPVSDYTVVQDVDAQHSLLLNASTPQSPPNSAKHLPAMPVMPMGYLSPELMGQTCPEPLV